MALFATIERDSPESVKLITLAHLASDFNDKQSGNAAKQANVVLYGYLTTVAATDTVKEGIERDLMNRSLSGVTKSLTQLGVPIEKIFVGDLVFSAPKARKIDIFLEVQGEAAGVLPGNVPTSPGKVPTVTPVTPVKDAELNVDSNRQLTLEMTAFKVSTGRRTIVPELTLKSTTGISPVEISKGYSAQLTMWKPKLEGVLRRIGQEGLADKVEFAVKITGGGALTKEFAKQISIEVAAALKTSLTFNVTVPGTKKELPIELSYSYGAYYQDGRVSGQGTGMIQVTILRFKGW